MDSSNRGSAVFSRRTFLGAVGVGAVGLGLGLAACSTGTKSEGYGQVDADVPQEYAKRRLVVMWHGFGDTRGDAIAKMADDYNKLQDEVYVAVQFQGGFGDVATKTTAGIAAGKVADVLNIGDQWRDLYLSKSIEPLNDLVDLSVYQDQFIDYGSVDGKVYVSPFSPSAPLYYWNKTLFGDAGLPDRGPETWTELREWGKQYQGITYRGTESKLHGFSSQDSDWQIQSIIYSFGGRDTDDSGWAPAFGSNAATMEAGQFLQGFAGDGTAYMADKIVEDFKNGVCGSAIMSTASLRGLLDEVDFELGAAFVPGEKTRALITGGGVLAIPTGLPEQRRKDAAAFVQHLAKSENSASWSALTGYIPAVVGAEKEAAFTEALSLSPYFSLAPEELQYAIPPSPMRAWISATRGEIFNTQQSIMSSGADPAKVFPELDTALNHLIDPFVKKYGKIA